MICFLTCLIRLATTFMASKICRSIASFHPAQPISAFLMFVLIAIHFAVANRQERLGETHSLGFTSHSCLRGHADVRPCLTSSLVLSS